MECVLAECLSVDYFLQCSASRLDSPFCFVVVVVVVGGGGGGVRACVRACVRVCVCVCVCCVTRRHKLELNEPFQPPAT